MSLVVPGNTLGPGQEPEVVEVPPNVPRMEELLLAWLMDPKVDEGAGLGSGFINLGPL